jgi:hypothetical protein
VGLKGYRLWVMGQRDSSAQSPTAKNTKFAMRPAGVLRNALSFAHSYGRSKTSVYRMGLVSLTV